MFIFNNDPNTPVNVKTVLWKLVLAAIVFWIVLWYLVPMIEAKPVHDIMQTGTILVAIFFLFDLIF